ncbi:uncharacterized protein LOC107484108 [Arachis duranensis]|uniref:GPI mannosyltransferase 2 n=1 Tax=Arachis duranensis TaxID=130453 RepID=A0A6P4D116_ARADU|nr:uncharacterized protein LOC107484108 [Arachis duranensis]XP_052117001.1 uncharacterized protein LOC107484108 [Arachis duranensis]
MVLNPPPHQHEQFILKSALYSRLLVLSLTIAWRILASPYDSSAPLNLPCLTANHTHTHTLPQSQTLLLPKLAFALENGVVWDSVYFVRIAQCGGYEYEQTYAFLPLLPISISFLSRFLSPIFAPFVGHRAVLAFSGYLICNVAFVFAALYLYRLSMIILKDPEIAFRATILFCFNPASIFYSSIYSESLYALLSFAGLYYFVRGGNNLASLFFALSGCARSNGVLNAGYLCFQTMHRAYNAMFQQKRTALALGTVIAGALRSVFVFAPFVAFQAYGYYNMCKGRLPDELRPWCKARVPLLYNYIQSHYWGVGFLKYFQLKQLPNFLLASPILSVALCSVVYYAKSRPENFFSLGFRTSIEEKSSGVVFLSDDFRSKKAGNVDKSSVKAKENSNLTKRKKVTEGAVGEVNMVEPATRPGYFSACVLPFVLHLAFMAATVFFVMHVQVATRFLSSSPPVYWFSSYIMAHPTKYRRWGYVIWAYSAAYIFLGSLLFSNFYPFT